MPTFAVALFLAVAEAPAQESAMGVRWGPPVEVASGEAHRGPWQQNESDFRYVDDPSVALDEAGVVTVVWANQAQKDVLLQRYGVDGAVQLQQPLNVSRSPDVFSWLPRVAVSRREARQIAVAWQEIVFSGGTHGGDIFFSRSMDEGRSFSTPVNLSRSSFGSGKGRLSAEDWDNGSFDLVEDPAGNWHVVWTDYEGGIWHTRSNERGDGFSVPVAVAGRGEAPPARAPSLAVSPTGTLYVAWTVGEDVAANLRLTRSTDGGKTFREPRVVVPGEGRADAPKLAVDRRGAIHLVWAEGPGSDRRQSQIRYARSTDGGDIFSTPQEISWPRGARRGPGAAFPSLALDREGRVYVTWELFPERSEWSRGLGGTVSNDGGRRFLPPAILPHSIPPTGINGSQQGLLMRKLAVNGNGVVVVVNSSFQPESGSRVWFIRGQAAR